MSVLPAIVLVEDDLRLSDLIKRYLDKNGFRVSTIARGDQAVEFVRRHAPELLILDIGLPGEDGFAICKQLRAFYNNPILMLTARDSDIDHVLGLELGADDYVIKPVEPRVLLARVNALLRRGKGLDLAQRPLLQFGGLIINTVSRSVQLNGETVSLSSNEYDLLLHLAAHAGRIQSRVALFQELYGRPYDGVDRMLDVRISQLRRKLGEDADRSERIKTIWRQGYLFVPDAW